MKKPIRQVFGKLLPAVLLAAVMACFAFPAVSRFIAGSIAPYDPDAGTDSAE